MTVAGGFDFDLCTRNAYLESRGVKLPAFKKTGTTISGVIFKVCRACNSQTCFCAGRPCEFVDHNAATIQRRTVSIAKIMLLL